MRLSREKEERDRAMTKLADTLGVISWFTGGILLGLVEIITPPKDPYYSTLLQLLPLLFLAGGIWFIFLQYQTIGGRTNRTATRLRIVMTIGWFAVFRDRRGSCKYQQHNHAGYPYAAAILLSGCQLGAENCCADWRVCFRGSSLSSLGTAT
ncbi:hypothetical protein AUI06_07235 [archaeon 13_2_20CM_2_52_21]|nr:MAG: hypothetical protein AUI06_07235 [archaeon 13_2_20CM_2_52_21]